MVAKGHDFPGVQLVGVVGADSGLGIPDFRSTERLFQLLSQTAGRAGRAGGEGQVLVLPRLVKSPYKTEGAHDLAAFQPELLHGPVPHGVVHGFWRVAVVGGELDLELVGELAVVLRGPFAFHRQVPEYFELFGFTSSRKEPL